MKKIVIFLVAIAVPSAIFSQPFSTQSQWETYFKNRIQELDPIEGIWSNSNTQKMYDSQNNLVKSRYNPQVDTRVIFKIDNKYNTYKIGHIPDSTYSDMTFLNTANRGIYLMENYYRNSSSTAKANAVLKGNGLLEFSYEKPASQVKYEVKQAGGQYYEGTKLIFEHQWIKTFPTNNEYEESIPTSGTGFCITLDGIIVTNYHVIEGAKSIKVYGINADFNKTFKAKVLVADKNNDLALIQIDDYEYNSLGTIPFTIKTGLAGVGENIFVLGYPLRSSMGDEIKLTNGIVSSRTGFQGDITSYQISAPVQPGNSGGPLFDSQGNLIGVINAKHHDAENASYAVKAIYLTSLIELLPNPPKLQTENSLTGSTLTQQVELIKKFVYIIETE